MGLLEKAEKIQTDTPDNEPAKVVPEPVSQPEPAAPEPKKEKKSRRSSRKKKTKKAKKERVPRVMPDGFEPAGTVRASGRYLVDTTANWGIMILTAAVMSQADADPTFPIIGALLMALGNMFYLPSKFSKSVKSIIGKSKIRTDCPAFRNRSTNRFPTLPALPVIKTGLFIR